MSASATTFRAAAGDLARLPEPGEGLLLREAFPLHEDPLRALDRLPRRERLGERVRLLAERDELLVAGARGLDRREQSVSRNGLTR